MRFMLQVRADAEAEAGKLPSPELIARMGKFNEEMVAAGVMLAGDGLQPSAKGARVTFSGDRRVVADGPFPASELVCGFWMIRVGSREEAIEWAKRVPFDHGTIEIRQVFEAEDFGPALSPEQQAAETRLREQAARN